jgi:hypothetical protein
MPPPSKNRKRLKFMNKSNKNNNFEEQTKKIIKLNNNADKDILIINDESHVSAATEINSPLPSQINEINGIYYILYFLNNILNIYNITFNSLVDFYMYLAQPIYQMASAPIWGPLIVQ